MKAQTELLVTMPVVNPRTGAKSKTFVFCGVVDRTDASRIDDWKTGDPGRFISKARIGFQAELYALAVEGSQGRVIREVTYRLMDRPTLKYSQPVFSYAVKKTGRKTALKLFDNRKQAETLANMQNGYVEERVKGDATRQDYEDRCYAWLLEDPARMVHHPHLLSEPRRQRARQWLWESCKRLLECKNCDRWLPNELACYSWERACPYLPLCECEAQGGDVNWIIEDQYETADPHPELGEVVNGGKTVVTYSSLTTHALCEQKYYWKVVRCLRPHRDDAEARWVGSAMHAGVAAYANGGLEAACKAIDEWANYNPVLGPDAAWKQEEQVAKARAMVRAAAVKWPDVKPVAPEPEPVEDEPKELPTGEAIPF